MAWEQQHHARGIHSNYIGLSNYNDREHGTRDDLLTVSLDSVENADAMFVANGQDGADTIDCSNSSLPVFLFGGNGRDTMIGGSANDVVFGDFGRVLCR